MKSSLEETKLELQIVSVKSGKEEANSGGSAPDVTDRTTTNGECDENGMVSNLSSGSHVSTLIISVWQFSSHSRCKLLFQDSELENVDGSKGSGSKRRKRSLVPLETLLLSREEENGTYGHIKGQLSPSDLRSSSFYTDLQNTNP